MIYDLIETLIQYGIEKELNSEKIKEFSGYIEDTSTRQFGGELYSVMQVIKWCKENNLPEEIDDYEVVYVFEE